MRKLRFIISLLLICSMQHLRAQSHLLLIEEKYDQLDSVQYLNNLRDAIYQSVIKDFNEPLDDHIVGRYSYIKDGINDQNIRFVLNVDIDTTKLDTDIFLLVRDSIYNFNIYCHDNKFNPTFYVFFVNDQLDIFGDVFPTFSKRFAKKIKIGIKRILKKRPKYILDCQHLPNTVLYVKDDKIFVYRVLQSEEYELNDYVTKFKNTEGFYH